MHFISTKWESVIIILLLLLNNFLDRYSSVKDISNKNITLILKNYFYFYIRF